MEKFWKFIQSVSKEEIHINLYAIIGWKISNQIGSGRKMVIYYGHNQVMVDYDEEFEKFMTERKEDKETNEIQLDESGK